MNKSELLKFLQSQRAMAIATHDDGDVWIANVFIGVDANCSIYFISSEDTKHSQHILKNPNVAFSTIWFNENDHADRKGVQGRGMCTPAVAEGEIATGIQLHNENYPKFKHRITVEWIKENDSQSRVWVIRPSYIKFWNDKLYGEQEMEEFTWKIS